MNQRSRGRVVLLVAALTALAATPVLAGRDGSIAQAVTRVASQFGWSVNLHPPDPCFPPDPCKPTLRLDVDHEERTDLNHEVRFNHTSSDGEILPCIKVLLENRDRAPEMAATVSIEDPAVDVVVQVPSGYVLAPSSRVGGGYVLVPSP